MSIKAVNCWRSELRLHNDTRILPQGCRGGVTVLRLNKSTSGIGVSPVYLRPRRGGKWNRWNGTRQTTCLRAEAYGKFHPSVRWDRDGGNTPGAGRDSALFELYCRAPEDGRGSAYNAYGTSSCIVASQLSFSPSTSPNSRLLTSSGFGWPGTDSEYMIITTVTKLESSK